MSMTGGSAGNMALKQDWERLAYVDISDKIAVVDENFVLGLAYCEMGQVVIRGNIKAGNGGVVSLFTISDDSYIPRATINGIVAYPSSATDAGKVYTAALHSDGTASVWAVPLGLNESVVFVYPARMEASE